MYEYAERELDQGKLVVMPYKSGVYIGETVEMSGARAVVKVLAVVKHPEQGDLHNPYDPDVPMFHERRALAYTEKANVLVRELKPYAGEAVPDYRASLTEALEAELRRLDGLKRWAERGISQLEGLRTEYKL